MITVKRSILENILKASELSKKDIDASRPWLRSVNLTKDFVESANGYIGIRINHDPINLDKSYLIKVTPLIRSIIKEFLKDKSIKEYHLNTRDSSISFFKEPFDDISEAVNLSVINKDFIDMQPVYNQVKDNDFVVSFNTEYLSELAKSIGDSKVILTISRQPENATAIKVTSLSYPESIGLLMPLKLPEIKK